jgi:hypothetical protein
MKDLAIEADDLNELITSLWSSRADNQGHVSASCVIIYGMAESMSDPKEDNPVARFLVSAPLYRKTEIAERAG